MQEFTLQSALNCKSPEALKNWTISFLESEGNNNNLAVSLRKKACKRIKLVKYPLADLVRAMGPEDGMPFQEDEVIWEKRVKTVQDKLKNGYEPPPLIVTDFWNEQHISDGNHRHEAFLRNGIKEYWVIFFEKA